MKTKNIPNVNQGRVVRTLRNTIYGVTSQIVIVILNFITRSVFIKFLSVELLGINGLLTNVLLIFSLTELGLGGAIVYSMYKPIAENNYKKVASLMHFYKYTYMIIGLLTAVIGLSMYPFIQYLVKGYSDYSTLRVVYLLFLFNSVVSYFFSYKRTLLTADQKEYIISKFRVSISIVKTVTQIVSLILFKNFYVYLGIQIIMTVLENVLISLYVKKRYNNLQQYKKERLSYSEKKEIFNNVKALFIYKVGSIALDGTDNIIISTFVGVTSLGILSNYVLIVTSLTMMLSHFTKAITASVGNFVVKETKERQLELLNIINFVFYIIHSYCVVCLVALLNPLIYVWIGDQYTLSLSIVIVLALNWYLYGMMSPFWTFRATLGLFKHGKYRPILSAFMNIIVSIMLAKWLGLIGVLLGTTITRILTNLWFDPYIIYKYGYNEKPYQYYIQWIKLFMILCLTIGLTMYMTSLTTGTGLFFIFIDLFVCVFVWLIINFIMFFKSVELITLMKMIRPEFTKNR